MRLLHTSDWHLGRTFKNVGMLGVQERALDHVVEVVRREQVDAVVVSGDVYDRAVPGPDAVALLSETLERLVDAGAVVVLSSGNHDSAVRLGFASGLLRHAGVHVATQVAGIGQAIQVGEVRIYPIPYLEPVVCAGALGASARTHAAVMTAAMDRILARHPGGRSVVLAHAVVTGAEECESERDISVGGISAIPRSVFEGVDYVAMGHLHGPQYVGGAVHYSGSPYAMSFGEATHRKSVSLVDLRGGAPQIERIPVPIERPLARLRGRIDDLLTDPRHRPAQAAWCSIVLTDPVRPPAAMERLRRRFPHALELSFDPEGVSRLATTYAARVADRSPHEVCCDFVEHVRGGHGATEQEREALAAALEQGRLARAAREGEGGFGPGESSAGARAQSGSGAAPPEAVA